MHVVTELRPCRGSQESLSLVSLTFGGCWLPELWLESSWFYLWSQRRLRLSSSPLILHEDSRSCSWDPYKGARRCDQPDKASCRRCHLHRIWKGIGHRKWKNLW